MRTFNVFLFPVIAIVLLSATVVSSNNYTLAKDYTVTINGTSNLHDWNEKVGTVTGNGIVSWNTDGGFDLNALKLEMSVFSIKSTEGSTMDNNTYKALKGEANPEITIALATPVKSIQFKANNATINANCNLTIAGVTKSIILPVKITTQDHNKVEFDGTKTIKMTDYGVNPPTALLGVLKTANEITISFKANFTLVNN